MRKPAISVAVCVLIAAVAAYLLWPRTTGGVNLYCSVDQDQFQPLVAEFERQTGVHVASQGETEASRSVGIASKLDYERENPVADVFWGNEAMNTVFLRDRGVLAPLPPAVVASFPKSAIDAKGTFVLFAGRARVLLVNTKLLPDPRDWPTSVGDLASGRWGGPGRGMAVAKPLTGTTYTHAVALLVRDGDKAKAFWEAVAAKAAKGEIKAVPGNGAVAQQVKDPANGIAFGLTDTDDARVAVTEGAPVAVVYPDQGEGQPGTFVTPNTVALVRGGPHPEAARRLLAWLVSRETEERLAKSEIANIPVRDDVPAPPHVKRPGKDFRAAAVDWDAVGASRDRWAPFLQSLFER